MAQADFLFRFLGDSRDLDRATRGAKGSLAGVEKQSGLTGRAMSGLEKGVAGLAGAITVAEIGRFAFDAASMASQFEQAAGSAEKVLGPALEGLHDDLENTRQVMGLNAGELDTIVAKFGLLTDGMGLSDQAQADFITHLIETGGELAAFRGNVGDAPAAVDAMGAALRGEFDPLEQFGIKLSEAAIQEQILEEKTDPANAELSEQEIRILAIQTLIDEKASAAVGSLAEAEGTLAGQVNEANARFEDMKAQLGERLLPVISDALGFLVETFESWDRLVNPGSFENTQLGSGLRKMRDWLERNFGWVDRTADAVSRLFGGTGVTAGRGAAAGRGDRGDRGGQRGDFGMPSRQLGGVVPGPFGAPVPILAHGGEMVTNPRLGQGLGGGINITVNAGVGDPQEIARKIVEVLEIYNRTNGAVPITVARVEL